MKRYFLLATTLLLTGCRSKHYFATTGLQLDHDVQYCV